jgi:hypothetical protein
MNNFLHTQLEPDEKIVFGPVARTKTTSFSATGPGQQLGGDVPHPQQASLSQASGQIIGITNLRIIIEDLKSSDKTRTYTVRDVRQVYVRRKTQHGQETLMLTKVLADYGQMIKLNLSIPTHAEKLIQETFTNAEIIADKGLLGSKGCLIAVIVVLALVVLICVGPLIASAMFRLFQ